MAKQQKQISSRNYIILFVLAVLAYAALTFFAPISQSANRFNISEANLRLIQLSFVIPIVLIWAAAAYGAFQVRKYASLISSSLDGKAFATISNGLGVLVGGLVLGSLISGLRSYVADNPGNVAALQVFTNYFTLAYSLTAFVILYKGGKQLLAVGKVKLPTAKKTIVTVLVFAAVAFVTYLIFQNPYRNSTPDASRVQSYYLSDTMIFLTIVVPYAILWWFGSMSGLAIRQYQLVIKGTLYRRALAQLGFGLITIIAFSVLLQIFAALAPIFSTLGLGAILALVYLILILYAAGYLIIASGSRKLKKIEEV